MRQVIIENGSVVNVVESDELLGIASDTANINDLYINGEFVHPTLPVPHPVPVYWNISVGSFFDRFGSHKWSILASTDPIIQALVKDCTVRKFIDLQRPDLPAALDTIIAAGFAIDKESILGTPCQPGEEP